LANNSIGIEFVFVINRSADPSENAALGAMKGIYDSYLDAQLNADLITGDPRAVQRWKDARQATIDYKNEFDANRVIRQLGDNDTTPEQVKNWILGANSVGAKKEAGLVVEQLKNTLGVDSPSMGILRQEVLFDIVEPLLRETPNFKTFATKFDNFVKNNPTLSNELFPDSVGNLGTLRRFATAIENNTASGLDLNINQTIARVLFGHEIAKGAVRVNLGTNLLNLVRSTAGLSNKQRLLSEALGYDITSPLLPKAPVAIGGAVQTGINQENQ